MRAALMLSMVAAGGCTQPGGPAPSLAPRAAEALDPRVPVEVTAPSATVDPALAARLAELLAEARAGNAAFADAAAAAERLVAAAGAPQSESWVVAEQALSVAVAAKASTTRALGDIDAISADRIALRGWIAPADQAAVAAAAAEVAGLDRAQAARIDAMRARLRG
jgi:hypothetical protein